MEVEDAFFVVSRARKQVAHQAWLASKRLGHKYTVIACIRHKVEGVMVTRIE